MESTIFFPKKTVSQKKGTVCYLSMTALWLITNNMFWHLPYSAIGKKTHQTAKPPSEGYRGRSEKYDNNYNTVAAF